MTKTETPILADDWVTFQEAARAKRANYHALRMHVYQHGIPTRKIGPINVVRLSDLVGYLPRGQKAMDAV